MNAWQRVCSHGDSEAEVRAALAEAQDNSIQRFRAEQRAAGLPLDVIEAVAIELQQFAAAKLDAMVASAMFSMAVSANAIRVH